MNEFMKGLAMIAPIFIPPAFIAGDEMVSGLFYARGVIVFVAVLMVIFFWGKRWLSDGMRKVT